MLFDLSLQPFAQREAVCSGPCETGQDGLVIGADAAHFHSVGLHDLTSHGHLAIADHSDFALVPDAQDRRGAHAAPRLGSMIRVQARSGRKSSSTTAAGDDRAKHCRGGDESVYTARLMRVTATRCESRDCKETKRKKLCLSMRPW